MYVHECVRVQWGGITPHFYALLGLSYDFWYAVYVP
jgi:hypothetical protein